MIALLVLILLSIIIIGVRVMAAFDDITAAQSQIAAALATIAQQKAASITPQQAAQILANEQTNLASANALITP